MNCKTFLKEPLLICFKCGFHLCNNLNHCDTLILKHVACLCNTLQTTYHRQLPADFKLLRGSNINYVDVSNKICEKGHTSKVVKDLQLFVVAHY